jgi:hypothetical protein
VENRVISYSGLVIGAIGAFGQTWVLRHELIDTYPYKMMNYPPNYVYEQIGVIGTFLCPLIASGLAYFFVHKKQWLAWVIPVIACPLIFSVLFLAYTLIWELASVESVSRNFDDTTPAQVAIGFLLFAVTLSGTGALIATIGWVCASRLQRFLKIQ